MASHALVDTSVLISLDEIDADKLPPNISIATITLAELAAGPHAAKTVEERARRQETLQHVESAFRAIPFDRDAARIYGRIYAAATAAGRRSRARIVDYLIAATAAAAGLPLYTRNPSDFEYLENVVEVIAI